MNLLGKYIIIGVVSFCVSSLLICIFAKIYTKFSLLDNPQKYGKNRAPIPYSVGVVLFLTFFLITSIFLEITYKLILIWIFGAIITLISFIDDRVHVPPYVRLFMQIGIGSIIGFSVIKSGYVSSFFDYLMNVERYYLYIEEKKIYLIPFLFSIFWYVTFFNATNWSDGIEGNAAIASLASCMVIFILSMKLFFEDSFQEAKNNSLFIMTLSATTIGMLLPFIRFETKEKILMGDSGTMFLGFLIATLGIIAGGKIGTTVLSFGIYIIDAFYVIAGRILRKQNILLGDNTHLHHRLLARGISKTTIRYVIFFSSLFFGLLSLMLSKEGKIVLFLIMIAYVIFLPKILSYVWKHETR